MVRRQRCAKSVAAALLLLLGITAWINIRFFYRATKNRSNLPLGHNHLDDISNSHYNPLGHSIRRSSGDSQVIEELNPPDNTLRSQLPL